MEKEREEAYDIKGFALDNLTFKTYPVTEFASYKNKSAIWDKYKICIYWKGKYLAHVIADGVEVDYFRYKDNPDPDSYTYDELRAMGVEEKESPHLNERIKEIRKKG